MRLSAKFKYSAWFGGETSYFSYAAQVDEADEGEEEGSDSNEDSEEGSEQEADAEGWRPRFFFFFFLFVIYFKY